MGHLSEDERSYVRMLKDLHIFRVFSVADMRKLTKNGGVSVT